MRVVATVLVVLLGVPALFYGCSGTSEDIVIEQPDAGSNACTTTNQKLCKKACQCADMTACAFTDDGVSSVTFETQEACEAYMVDQICRAEGSDEFDFDACSIALDMGKCVQVTGTLALRRPEVCFTRKPDGGTPDAGDAGHTK